MSFQTWHWAEKHLFFITILYTIKIWNRESSNTRHLVQHSGSQPQTPGHKGSDINFRVSDVTKRSHATHSPFHEAKASKARALDTERHFPFMPRPLGPEGHNRTSFTYSRSKSHSVQTTGTEMVENMSTNLNAYVIGHLTRHLVTARITFPVVFLPAITQIIR